MFGYLKENMDLRTMRKFIYHGSDPDPVKALARFFDHNGAFGCDVETVSLEDRTPLGAAFAINPSESIYFPIDSHLFPWGLLGIYSEMEAAETLKSL